MVRRLLAILLLSLALPGLAATAPSFALKTPAGATVRYPEDALGQPTVLMFWPSWCPFSRALQPYVDDIWKDYRHTGIKVWTINIKEDKDPVQVMRDRGLSFPLLINGDEVAREYRLQYTPWLVVMNGAQEIIYTRPPKPPTPVDTAKEVRAVLNGLLGDKAVPLPVSYPKPYDLHLKRKEDMVPRLAPTPIPQSEWSVWLGDYLAAIPAEEMRSDLSAAGPLENGKAAIARARELWTQAYGQETSDGQAPYRSYRMGNRWVVLGDGLNPKLGQGLVAVLRADNGQVIRLENKRPATP